MPSASQEVGSERLERRVWLATALLLAALFGALSHWVIFEYDLFWQVRAGREILAGQGVQRVDHWSYLFPGHPWVNFEWVSTAVEALLVRIGGGYGGLSWLRSGLTAIWMFALATFVRKGAGRGWQAWLLTLLLVPWAYAIANFRLQMRPDLFGICWGAATLAVWLSSMTLKRKRIATLAVLLAWANFHSGTCLFGIVFFALATVFGCDADEGESWGRRAVWIAAGVATWFATPYGWQVVAVTGSHLGYDYAHRPNPDQQPFQLSLLDLSKGGWVLRLWLAYTAVAVACTVRLLTRPLLLPRLLSGLYRRVGFTVVLEAFLTLLAFRRIRAIPYQLTFTLPLVAAGLRSWLDAPRWRRATAGVCLAAGLFVLALVLPDEVAVGKPLGSEVFDSELPVQSVEFLREARPSRNLLNAYKFGGYLIDVLPEYPVAMDGRWLGFPEGPFMDEQDAARADPARYAEFLRRWGINAVLEEPPGMIYDPAKDFFSDTHAALYPTDEWAQVFFDNASVVYLRRIPEHARVIEQHEYKTLRRGLPPGLGAELKGLPDDTRKAFEGEIDRCLVENPRCIYCLIGKAAFHRVRGDNAHALQLLERALAINPGSADALVVLAAVYESLGRTAEADAVRRRFERLTTAPK